MSDLKFEDRSKTNQEELVLTAIKGGADRLGLIMVAVGVGYNDAGYRPLDATIQRLRKAGSIVLDGKPRRWRLA